MDSVAGVNFKFFLHAHSHVAFLGWVYIALFVLITGLFLPAEKADSRNYRIQLWLTHLSVLGMLFSFPVQGYAAVSISFSTLHIFLSWYFSWKIYKDTRGPDIPNIALQCIWAALFFLSISAIGPFSLGPIMAKGGSGGTWYNLAIYYYLHFQYNGWFTLAILGILFRVLDLHSVSYSRGLARKAFINIAVACVPAYLLSALWTQPSAWVYIIAGMAALLQLIGLLQLLALLRPIRHTLRLKVPAWVYLLLCIALAAFVIKIVLQLASALPYLAKLAYTLRNFIIGYLHLVLLGFVSCFLLGIFLWLGVFTYKRAAARTGLVLFLTGFFSSEALLFGQGILFWAGEGYIPFYTPLLAGLSALMPLGVLLLLFSQFRKYPEAANYQSGN